VGYVEELRLTATKYCSGVMEEAKGGLHCLGTARLWKGEAMVSVNFDQGVEGGKGLKGKARRRG
jgi:hypothetical protein